MIDHIYLNGLITGINLATLVLSAIILCDRNLFVKNKNEKKPLLTSCILVGIFCNIIVADTFSILEHAFPSIVNPYIDAVKVCLNVSILGGFCLEAFALQNRPINWKVFAMIWAPSVIQLILCVFAKNHPVICRVAAKATFVYMYVIYICTYIELCRWDKRMKEIYSDVDYRQTQWFRRYTLFIMLICLLWIPYFITPNFFFLLNIAFFVGNLLLIALTRHALLYDPSSIDESLQETATTSADSPAEEDTTTDMDVPEWGNRVDEIMRTQEPYLQPTLDLNALSLMVGVNKTYMSRYLNQVRKTSFYDYVNGYRLEKSCQMLREGTMSMEEIAMQCGFSNYNTFGRLFKEKYDMSPREYQKKMG